MSIQSNERIAQQQFERYLTIGLNYGTIHTEGMSISKKYLVVEITNTGNMSVKLKRIELQKSDGRKDTYFIPRLGKDYSTGELIEQQSMDKKILDPGERVEYWIELTDENIDKIETGRLVLIDAFNGEYVLESLPSIKSSLQCDTANKKSIESDRGQYKTYKIIVPRPDN